MSDDLQSGGISSDIGETGQSGESTNAEATINSSAETAQPATKANWYDDPEYRKMQSERDRREAQLRQEVQALKTQQEQIHLSGMDDLERTQYERDKAAKQAEALAQQLRRIEEDQVRLSDLQGLSRKHGVPVEALESATDAIHARELVLEYKEKMKGQRAQEVQAKEQKNAGHLERGAPAAPQGADWYLKRKDARGYVMSLLKGE